MFKSDARGDGNKKLSLYGLERNRSKPRYLS